MVSFCETPDQLMTPPGAPDIVVLLHARRPCYFRASLLPVQEVGGSGGPRASFRAIKMFKWSPSTALLVFKTGCLTCLSGQELKCEKFDLLKDFSLSSDDIETLHSHRLYKYV